MQCDPPPPAPTCLHRPPCGQHAGAAHASASGACRLPGRQLAGGLAGAVFPSIYTRTAAAIPVEACSITLHSRLTNCNPTQLCQAGCCSKPRGQWQLVLLDHGLYRRLDDSFRLEYAGLWHSLVFAGELDCQNQQQWRSDTRMPCLCCWCSQHGAVGDISRCACSANNVAILPRADEEGIRRHSTAMNAGDAVPLFVGMLTQRPWEKVTQKGQASGVGGGPEGLPGSEAACERAGPAVGEGAGHGCKYWRSRRRPVRQAKAHTHAHAVRWA